MRKFGAYGLFAANLAVVLWFWWDGSAGFFGQGIPTSLIALGRLFGLLSALFVLLQFTLIGRNVWVERTFGLDRLAHFHRFTGFLTISFVIVHFLLILSGYALLNEAELVDQLSNFLMAWEDVLGAFLALLILTGVGALSLYIVRKRLRYETWFYAHLLTYLAIAFAFGHQLENGDIAANPVFAGYWSALYLAVFGSLLVFRFLRPAWLYQKHRFRVARLEPASENATSVYITGDRMDEFRVKPGQFLMFRFLDKERIAQNHPFSASMLPKNGELRFTAKKLGDFTSAIPDIKPGTPVVIDGPFGVFRPHAPEGRKFLFVAGGIGITPIRAILESLPGNTDSVLVYGNRTEKEIVFRDELEKIAEEKPLAIHHVISDDPAFAGEKGRVDLALLRRLAPDLADREIFLCGPPPMLRALRSELRAAGTPSDRVRFERFSLH